MYDFHQNIFMYMLIYIQKSIEKMIFCDSLWFFVIFANFGTIKKSVSKKKKVFHNITFVFCISKLDRNEWVLLNRNLQTCKQNEKDCFFLRVCFTVCDFLHLMVCIKKPFQICWKENGISRQWLISLFLLQAAFFPPILHRWPGGSDGHSTQCTRK